VLGRSNRTFHASSTLGRNRSLQRKTRHSFRRASSNAPPSSDTGRSLSVTASPLERDQLHCSGATNPTLFSFQRERAKAEMLVCTFSKPTVQLCCRLCTADFDMTSSCNQTPIMEDKNRVGYPRVPVIRNRAAGTNSRSVQYIQLLYI
jgi:hypothetical protein